MHEMTMVKPLVDAVLEECERCNAKSVRSVHLSIGEMIDVIEQYVPGLFRFLARGTAAENAEIVIERIPLYVRCNECGDIFSIDVHDEKTWHCPRCGVRQNYRVFSGREFRIDSIEFVVDSEKDETDRLDTGTDREPLVA